MPAVTIKALVGSEIWNSYYKFCTIRNPFDKVISAFHNFVSPNTKNPDPAKLKEQFENWVVSSVLPIDRNKYIIGGRFCLDGILRYESLLDDLETLCNNLNLVFSPQDLLKLKSSTRPRGALDEYYTDNSLRVVAHAYQLELEMFGYEVPRLS